MTTLPASSSSPLMPFPAGFTLEDIARIETAATADRAPSTLETYASAWRGFERWCRERGFSSMPAEPGVICAYFTVQAERGLGVGMITLTSAAIAYWHTSRGLGNPTDSDAVRRVRRGLRRIIGVAPRRQMRPLLVEDVREIVASIDRTTPAGIRDSAIILLGFASALRRAELAVLDLNDIEVKPGGLLITVRRSKGDPDAAGQVIAVAEGQRADTDPIGALAAWLRVRPAGAGAVFTRLHANGSATDEPIRAATIARVIKARAHAAGFAEERIAAHSLRAGHVTSASMAGVALDRIAAQTRHQDVNMLVRYYIRPIQAIATTSSRDLGL